MRERRKTPRTNKNIKGEVTTDLIGRSVWQFKTELDEPFNPDTARLKALGDGIQLVEKPRRSLDDLRKLSQEIKTSKNWQRPRK